jgi:hypothetical protein
MSFLLSSFIPLANPSMSQSSGSNSEDCKAIGTNDSFKEVGETSTFGTLFHYLDNPSSTATTPSSGYWEDMEAAGLKKRKALVVTLKKSPEEILDEALRRLVEHSPKPRWTRWHHTSETPPTHVLTRSCDAP